MKGHFYTFFAMSKLSLIFAMGYTIFIWIFMLFFDEEEIGVGIVAMICWGIFTLIWSAIGTIGVLLSRGKIRQYAITFPQGKKGYVLAVYLFCIIMTVIGVISGGIGTLISGAETNFSMIITIINIIFILMWLQLVFTLIFGESIGSISALILVLLIVYGGSAYLLFGDISFLLDITEEDVYAFFENLDDNLKVILSITNIALLSITFPLSCKFIATEKST